jgi:hypothetical protein
MVNKVSFGDINGDLSIRAAFFENSSCLTSIHIVEDTILASLVCWLSKVKDFEIKTCSK